MEMEVVAPVPAVDFNFDSTCSSPYMTAPSSPQRIGNFFFTAPTSPSRVSSFYRHLKDVSTAYNSSSSTIPFQWEEKPGTPRKRAFDNKKNCINDDNDEDFEFNFSGQLTERTSLSADELFDCGKIRPLKPPPRYDQTSTVSSPRSPKSRASHRKDIDPKAATIKETRKTGDFNQAEEEKKQQQRGRERKPNSSLSYVHKGSRSLSPLRASDMLLEQEENTQTTEKMVNSETRNPKSYAASILSAISLSPIGYKKWKLRDLLLFRSASEGRATSNVPLKKYAALSRKEQAAEDVKNSSFRSTESSGSVSGSKRRGLVSAHELHYTANRAVSEELKRKTYLPYKQGLLGCLGFNRPGVPEISRGVGSLTRG